MLSGSTTWRKIYSSAIPAFKELTFWKEGKHIARELTLQDSSQQNLTWLLVENRQLRYPAAWGITQGKICGS